MNKSPSWIALSLAVLLSGCAGSVKNMRELPADAVVAPPQKDGGRLQPPIKLRFRRPIERLRNRRRKTHPGRNRCCEKPEIAYRTKPGTRLFMTIGENADFATADHKPNKTYYAYVAPRMGAWKAASMFEPKTAKDLDSAEFKIRS